MTVVRTVPNGDVAFTAIKEVRVCFDVKCGHGDHGSGGQQNSSSASGASSGVTGSGGPNASGGSGPNSSASCAGSGSIGSSGSSGSSGTPESSGSSASGSSGNFCGCIEECDPFPNDGYFTYTYKITNDASSATDLIAFEVLVPAGSVVDAGSLGGAGIAPSDVTISDNRVEWDFFDTPIAPGEMSQELYIISPLGPDFVGASISGGGALDQPVECVGPAVECELCPDDNRSGSSADSSNDNGGAWGGEANSDDRSDGSSSSGGDGPCYFCPEGLASGPPCDDHSSGSEDSSDSSSGGSGDSEDTGNTGGKKGKPTFLWLWRVMFF
ncbi:MAG: hypothetical protein GY715_22095 [Planctomycetes bacterium]|nr:hypothetical protein [Planctomycetota bacterium]